MPGFSQVDVFSREAFGGNPVAVVHDADDLDGEQMAAIARWTNLSETTFLCRPTSPEADYRLRIFTPGRELPFAGHPTLGSARAWLEAGGSPRGEDLVQECGAGLVRVRRAGPELAFAAPALVRSGPPAEEDLATAARLLGLRAGDVVDAQWVDNGPGWLGLLLRDADAVLGVRPDLGRWEDQRLGVVGPHPSGGEADVEVRAFCPGLGVVEDPVTGSLNAGLAMWLIGAGHLPASYVAAQGTALGRTGRVRLHRDEAGEVWTGGSAVVRVRGALRT